MKIVSISDSHNKHEQLLDIPNGDIIIFSGDMSGIGHYRDIKSFFDWFSKLPHKHKVCIAGNHDYYFDLWHEKNPNQPPYNPKDVVPNNVIYLENESVEIEGLKVWGSPMTPYFFNWAFNLVDEELETFWNQIPDDTDIIITHGPAYGYGDKVVRGGMNVGCKYLLKRIQDIKPKLHICGHIHEGYGLYKLEGGNTIMVNASILDEDYRLVNKPIIIEL